MPTSTKNDQSAFLELRMMRIIKVSKKKDYIQTFDQSEN